MDSQEMQAAVNNVLAVARRASDDESDPTEAIMILMGAAIWLQTQIGMSKEAFLVGAGLQWDDTAEWLHNFEGGRANG